MRIIIYIFFATYSVNSFAAPKIFFTTAVPYDNMCARGFKYSNQKTDSHQVKQSWIFELNARLSEFQKIWDTDSPNLFKILVTEFKKDFLRTEYTAALSACADAPSMPEPLVLNVSRYLTSYMPANKKPKDMSEFVDLPFHELLHIWLDENFKKTSPIKNKYKNEPITVVNHIHLFALQSLIYEKSNNAELWKKVRQFYFKKGGGYQRAIEILDKERRKTILAELLP